MKFAVYYHDVQNPDETKTAFTHRFLSSLQASFHEAQRENKTVAAVLIVRSGVHKSFWNRLAFWRPLKTHNFPLKAQWAAEALTERGYEWMIGRSPLFDDGRPHPALLVTFPKTYFQAPEADRKYPILVWDRDKQSSSTTRRGITVRR